MNPVICNYYVTYRCNARCGFCSIWQDRSVPREIESSAAVVCRNLADVRSLGVRIVDFTGGEPLLHDGLPEILKYARRIGLRTTVTSNGIRYPSMARELAGVIDILQFSLHGADAETHDAVTVTPSFDRVMESVECARSLGDLPTFIHTVTDDNISRVPDLVMLARKLGVPLFLNPCFPYFGNDGLSPAGAHTLNRMARGPGISIDRGFLRFLIDGGNRTDAPRCLAVTSTIVVSPDDRLILPCFHHRMRSLPIEGRLRSLYLSDDVQREREREGRYSFCEGCAVNCYIRASLFRRLDRYFLPSVTSGMGYLSTLLRSRLTARLSGYGTRMISQEDNTDG